MTGLRTNTLHILRADLQLGSNSNVAASPKTEGRDLEPYLYGFTVIWSCTTQLAGSQQLSNLELNNIGAIQLIGYRTL